MIPQGLLVVISAPSGGGKSTVIRHILKEGNPRYRYSISATTRKKRPLESHGVDYWFVDDLTFQQMIEQGALVEYERVHDHWYGTPKKPIEDWLAEGCIVFFDIDVKGAFSIQRHFPDHTLMIFLDPPDRETLLRRLSGRGTESEKEVALRLHRMDMELELGQQFPNHVANIVLKEAITDVKQLIKKRLNGSL